MSAALDRAVQAYDHAPPGVRRHVRLRRLLSRLSDVEALTPRSGSVLEIGCGHGLVARYLAAASPERRVHGVDIDERKIAAALAAPPFPGVTFAVGDALRPPSGPFAAVVVVDVLYLLPAEAQRAAVRAAYEVLAPGGVFVWKAQEDRPRLKYWFTKFQERVATGIGLTVGASLTFLPREAAISALEDAGFRPATAHPMRGRLYSDVIYLGRKPA
jgi:2-polyprenyl-6-hydroxyphenyl methylase/3-demethylubiquinone-9 3-methyltransferase